MMKNKFNINDEVFFLNGAEIQSGRVNKITLHESDIPEIIYGVQDLTFTNSRVFGSIDDICNNMRADFIEREKTL